MSSIQIEVGKLGSRDVRVRRRAVRKLYEMDDSDCLAAFVPLLSDEDIWFRDRARRAFDNWCGSKHADLISDSLETVDDDTRLLFAGLLPRLGGQGEEIAETLAESESVPIRCEVRAYQLESGSVQQRLSTAGMILSDPSHLVRRVLAKRITTLDTATGTLTGSLLADRHPRVIADCLAALNSAGEDGISATLLTRLVASSVADVRLEARLMAIRIAIQVSDFEQVARLLPDEELRIERALIDSITDSAWQRWAAFIEHLEHAGAWRAAALLATSSGDPTARELQVSLAGDDRVPVTQRLRIIDRLMVRAADINLEELIGTLLCEDDPRLVAAAERLGSMSEV